MHLDINRSFGNIESALGCHADKCANALFISDLEWNHMYVPRSSGSWCCGEGGGGGRGVGVVMALVRVVLAMALMGVVLNGVGVGVWMVMVLVGVGSNGGEGVGGAGGTGVGVFFCDVRRLWWCWWRWFYCLLMEPSFLVSIP